MVLMFFSSTSRRMYSLLSPSNRIWYENRPLGIQRSGTMMKEISEAAGLSKKCTNYSVRATAITLWSNARLSNRHMAIFGHRNEQSLRSYNARLSSGPYNTATMCSPTHLAWLQSHPQAPQTQILSQSAQSFYRNVTFTSMFLSRLEGRG